MSPHGQARAPLVQSGPYDFQAGLLTEGRNDPNAFPAHASGLCPDDPYHSVGHVAESHRFPDFPKLALGHLKVCEASAKIAHSSIHKSGRSPHERQPDLCTGLKARAMLTLAFNCGLQAGEVVK